MKDMMIKIFENLISESDQQHIENTLLDSYFPWFFNERTVYDVVFENDTPQFTHNFLNITTKQPTNAFGIIEPIIVAIKQKLNLKNIHLLRVKANFLQKFSNSRIIHPAHVDSPLPNHYSMIYYPISSDGPIYFFNRHEEGNYKSFDSSLCSPIETIEPVKGNILFFNSNIFHAASTPTIFKKRLAINFVFQIDGN